MTTDATHEATAPTEIPSDTPSSKGNDSIDKPADGNKSGLCLWKAGIPVFASTLCCPAIENARAKVVRSARTSIQVMIQRISDWTIN